MADLERTDKDLMSLFQSGDITAFEHLYRRYKTPLFNYFVRFTHDRTKAEDLTQELFGKLIHKRSSFEKRSKLSTWLYTIARNLAVDAARRASHRKHASLDVPTKDDGIPLMERTPGNNPSPDRAAVAARIREDLNSAIAKLPEDQREVFLLREYQGLPFDEIAKVVGAKLGTVKSRMRYALSFLTKELEEHREHMRSLP